MKYLLSGEVCNFCNGLGVLPQQNHGYRIRIYFPNDSYHLLDDVYTTEDEARWEVIEMKHGDPNVEFEIVSPSGELIDV